MYNCSIYRTVLKNFHKIKYVEHQLVPSRTHSASLPWPTASDGLGRYSNLKFLSEICLGTKKTA
ncbi:MAG: hypothetical protein A2928_02090 [Candidatus Taylorbacteria bacterium RIFCSPLOWO2_01_FULL_45_15b]|uniref:Uncharacterized protein n=1 Tax=Candidatus Taylorbacteria bacterium RIFCSPLOWO2_01_FULL_45_15b TaxID=1802319 RepID=A0A1G2N921_9BACT|nr:MAG: hypothetical protein A2928_02090 [Candidatus Taylorbacteria bacterium RIFCSPLOWO2_01_FULL_45_15b]